MKIIVATMPPKMTSDSSNAKKSGNLTHMQYAV